MKYSQDVIIIGSGIGGLTCGAFLAKNGYMVRIFERLNQPGGYVNTFKRGDYWFEATTHQIGGFNNNLYLKKDLKKLGIDLSFIELDHCFETVFFENDKIIKKYLIKSGYKQAYNSFKNYFPQDESYIKNIFEIFSAITNDLLRLRRIQKDSFFYHPYDSITGLFLKKGKKDSLIKKIGINSYKNFIKYRTNVFSDLFNEINNNELKELFYQYCHFFIGSNPDRLSLTLMSSLIYHLMILKPVIPKSGTKSLINELIKVLKRNDGEINYKSQVKEIIINNNKAVGIKLINNEEFFAKYIISDLNAYITFRGLIKGKNLYSDNFEKKLKKYNPSRSIFQIYLGLPFDLKKYNYNASTTFFSNNLKKENNLIMTNYTTIDPSFSPNNKSSITIAEYDDSYDYWNSLNDTEYKKEKEKKQKKILNCFQKLTNIPVNKAEICFSATPKTMQYCSGKIKGSIFGLEKTTDEYSKYDNKTPINNLFLVGADTASSGSITSCFESGRLVSDLIKKN